MTPPGDMLSSISSLNNIETDVNGNLKDPETATNCLQVILSSNEGISALKSANKNFENALVLFFKILFSDNRQCSDNCLTNCPVVTDVFRSKLPKIKKQDWWKKFELEFLVKCIPKLSDRISPTNGSWVELWSFIANLIITDSALSTVPLNALLSITEIAFKKGKEDSEILTQAWKCWISLIDTFGRSPNVLLPAKTMNLLMKPLQACHTVSVWRIRSWIHLIKIKGLSSTEDKLKQLVETLCKAMYKSPGDKAMCRHLPDDCARAIMELVNLERVSELCLEDIVSVFEPCVDSRPSSDIMDKTVTAIFVAVNGVSDENRLQELSSSLFDQFINSIELLISNGVCNKIYPLDIFQRWIISDTTRVGDINKLMPSVDFRTQVLLPAITSLRSLDDDPSFQKKKPKKPHDSLWNRYCEVFTAWWATQNSSISPLDVNKTKYDEESNDYKALLALMLYPIYSYPWNQSIFKSWTLICEVSRAFNALRQMSRPLFDALLEQNVQKSIDVLSHLCYLDNNLCKNGALLFEKLCSKVNLMDVKHIMDLLNVLESAVNFKELTPSVAKLLKCLNEKSSELDQLNAHKVKTKWGKVSRKLESLAYVSDTKSQRTPFRTQSNFLQRLAKAEEKNRKKSSFLTSPYNDVDKNKDELPEGGECDVEMVSLNESNEDFKMAVLPIVNELTHENPATLSLTNEPAAQLNGVPIESESAVAEKENVILPAAVATNFSSVNKIKITNARDVKTVDSSSPSQIKKCKQFVGQKITPKKVTPSKVSYFDDDASDCVMVPPKPKTTPLTEHQMEMMVKRRGDIPALYQDLSQDTQLSNPPSIVVQEIHENANKIEEPEDIFSETTPCKDVMSSTPQTDKHTSAKKLDFDASNSTDNQEVESSNALLASKLDLSLNEEMDNVSTVKTVENDEESAIIDGSLEVLKPEARESQKTSNPEDEGPSGGRNRRKRKSEPIKFSPKLTRSKKNNHKIDLSKSLPLEIADDDINNKQLIDTPETSTPTSNGIISDKPVNKIEPSTGDALTITPSRKRKNLDLASNEESKKFKVSEECESLTKKLPVPRKKKKLFKLCSNNLENWLVKTEKVTKIVDNTLELGEDSPSTGKEVSECQRTSIDHAEMDDLNNSEDIVPGTQELDQIHITSTLLPEPSTPTRADIPNVGKVENEAECLENPTIGDESSPVKNPITEEESSPVKNSTTEDESSPDVQNELPSTKSTPKCTENESSPENALPDSPDNVDLIITSPSKRQRRATSVLRGEGDTYLENDSPQESNSRMLRKKSLLSPSKKQRKQSLPTGRSARMLHLAASSVSADDDNTSASTPVVRRRGNIVPQKFGENWPKGPMTDWVAHTPVSPYMSPARSVLKKISTPGSEEMKTPVRNRDTTTSPLLSSSKRRRVVFLDPPVTKGLLYERDSPFGALHLAAVPEGSPYPTWTPEDECLELPNVDMSSAPGCKVTDRSEDIAIEENIVPIRDELTIETKLADLQERVNLDESFLKIFATNSLQMQHLLVDCFNSDNLHEMVRSWTMENCILLCKLPEAFLRSVKNRNGERIDDVLKEIFFLFHPDRSKRYSTNSTQTVPPESTISEVQVSVLTRSNDSQTCPSMAQAATNTVTPQTVDGHNQANFPLPPEEELSRLLGHLGHSDALKYLSTALGLLATTNYD